MTSTRIPGSAASDQRPAAVRDRRRPAPSRRSQLHTATMLIPLAAIAVLAAGKATWRAMPHGWSPAGSLGFMQDARAQMPLSATKPLPPSAGATTTTTSASGQSVQTTAFTPATAPGATPVAPAAAPGGAAPPAATAAAGGGDAVSVLLEQANYWRNQQQYTQALASLNRALSIEPHNADVLAQFGQLQADRGDRAAAENALAQLRRVSPGDPRIDKIDQSLRVGPIPQEALTDARQLARDGRQTEAIDRYNRVFRGNPPPDSLAVEYYQTLAGTEGGWEKARDGLARVVRQNPEDLRAQLAYAQLLTYRDGARADGIARLAALSQNPAVADSATQSWRQALQWLPDSKDSTEALNTYLAVHPNDADVAAKLQTASNPPGSPDPATLARVAGFDQLNKNQLGDAAKSFQSSIDANPNDPDALGGLGIVRLRQKNATEAKSLLSRAIALDPDHRNRWQAALTAASNPAGAGGGGPNPATVLMNRGDYAAAERDLLRQLRAGGGDTVGLTGMLADSQALQNKLPQAEQSYRAALARNPNHAPSLVGLAGVLARQGRMQEASDLLDRAQATGDAKLVGQARATQLRLQASAISDPATQSALYRAAVVADPGNPWLRLDFARTLVKLKQLDQARSVMAEIVGGHPSNDALKAGIIFANETHDPDAVASLAAQLPASARTPDMLVTVREAQLQRRIAAALAQDDPDTARTQLLALATQADATGATGAAVARALYKAGDKDGAKDAIVTAQAANGNSNGAARLAYAAALLDVDQPALAQTMLRRIGAGADLAPQGRTSLAQLQAGLAVRTSDALNEKGRQADGFDRLAPALARTPDSPDLKMALARLYQGARKPREALAINQSLLQRDPANVDARRGAIDAALAMGRNRQAAQLVQEGLRMAPDDPRGWIASADVARAQGENVRALRDLERARELRQQQLGYSDNGDDSSTLPPPPQVTLQPGDAPRPAPLQESEARSRFTAGTRLAQADLLSRPPSLYPPDAAPPAATPVAAPPVYPPAPFAQPAIADAPPRRILDTQPTSLVPPAVARAAAENASADQLNGTELQAAQFLPAAAPAPQPAPPQQAIPRDQPAPQQPAPQQPAPQQAAAAPRDTGPFGRSQQVASADLSTDGATLRNPFRSAPRYAPSDPAGTLAATQASNDALIGAQTRAPADPMTSQIDRDIVTLRDQVAPAVSGGFAFRSRSGDSGLDKLDELTIPLEATFTPGGRGQMKLSVTPTLLSSGNLGGDANNLQRFGSDALDLTPPGPLTTSFTNGYTGPAMSDQHRTGVGLDLGYKIGNVSADIGASPIGFQEQNLLGGVEWAPKLATNVTLRLTGERRSVTDSILSYSGTKDTASGQKWGGVVRDRGYANLEFSAGRADFYVGGGGDQLNGRHTASNTEVEAGAGGSFPVYKADGQEVRVGLDLVYFGYSKNIRFFTLGQGGYFSPQQYVSGGIPVIYREQVDPDFSYEVGGTLGLQSYHEKRSPYYPQDPDKQATLVAETQQTGLNAVSGLNAFYPARSSSGFAGGAHALADYRVTPSLHIGGKATYAHSGNFDEATGSVYARYIFNGAEDTTQ